MTALRSILTHSIAALVLSVGMLGCGQDKPNNVPGSAQMVSSGNSNLMYMAPSDGNVYVYDHNNNHLIWSGRVMKGQNVAVDPHKNQVVVNGNVVSDRTLAVGSENNIYFEPSPMTEQTSQDRMRGTPDASNANSSQRGAWAAPSGTVTVQPGAQTVTHPDGTVTVSPELRVNNPSGGTPPATQPAQ